MNKENHISDEALQNRIAQLNKMDVDINALTQKIDQQIEHELTKNAISGANLINSEEQPKSFVTFSWVRIAAVLLILITLSFMLIHNTNKQPKPSENELQLVLLHHQLHDELWQEVKDVEEMNQILRSGWQHSPKLILNSDIAKLHACCLPKVNGELVGALRMYSNEKPVTIVIARLETIEEPTGKLIHADGKKLWFHRLNGLNMIMQQHGKFWVCTMADKPVNSLIKTAKSLELEHLSIQF